MPLTVQIARTRLQKSLRSFSHSFFVCFFVGFCPGIWLIMCVFPGYLLILGFVYNRFIVEKRNCKKK